MRYSALSSQCRKYVHTHAAITFHMQQQNNCVIWATYRCIQTTIYGRKVNFIMLRRRQQCARALVIGWTLAFVCVWRQQKKISRVHACGDKLSQRVWKPKRLLRRAEIKDEWKSMVFGGMSCVKWQWIYCHWMRFNRDIMVFFYKFGTCFLSPRTRLQRSIMGHIKA